MTNRYNSETANAAVDTLHKVTKLAKMGLQFDSESIAAAALKDILKAVERFCDADKERAA